PNGSDHHVPDFLVADLDVREAPPAFLAVAPLVVAGDTHVVGPKAAIGRDRLALPQFLEDAFVDHLATPSRYKPRVGMSPRSGDGIPISGSAQGEKISG